MAKRDKKQDPVNSCDRPQGLINQPLSGKRIMVTRSRQQAQALIEKLEALGAEVLECPVIKTVPPDNVGPLDEATVEIRNYQWVVFTSANGVDAFFAALYDNGLDCRRLWSVNICAIGPATAERLKANGLVADLISEKFTAKSVADSFLQKGDIAGQNILLPQADIARQMLKELFEAMDANVTAVTAYQTVIDDSSQPTIIEALKMDNVNWITFTSPSTVQNFLELAGKHSPINKNIKLASIGPVTSKIIKKKGLEVHAEAAEHTIDGLVEAIVG